MAKTIKVRIPRDGISTGETAVSFETQGFQGSACSLATQSLVKALGGDVVSDKATNEMYEEPPQQEYLKND